MKKNRKIFEQKFEEVEEWECGQEGSEEEVELPNEEILRSESLVSDLCKSQKKNLPSNVKRKQRVSVQEMIKLFEVVNASGGAQF